jgi:hypothetical protein
MRIRRRRCAGKYGGRVQAAGGKFEDGLNLLPCDVELVNDFVYGSSGLKVLEDGGHGHAGIAKHPSAAYSSRHAFDCAALGPIKSSHVAALLPIVNLVWRPGNASHLIASLETLDDPNYQTSGLSRENAYNWLHKWPEGTKDRSSGAKARCFSGSYGTAEAVPFQSRIYATSSSVVSPEFTEEEPQILRLTTPELKDVRGPVRSE